jgi:hypothetical protein
MKLTSVILIILAVLVICLTIVFMPFSTLVGMVVLPIVAGFFIFIFIKYCRDNI